MASAAECRSASRSQYTPLPAAVLRKALSELQQSDLNCPRQWNRGSGCLMDNVTAEVLELLEPSASKLADDLQRKNEEKRQCDIAREAAQRENAAVRLRIQQAEDCFLSETVTGQMLSLEVAELNEERRNSAVSLRYTESRVQALTADLGGMEDKENDRLRCLSELETQLAKQLQRKVCLKAQVTTQKIIIHEQKTLLSQKREIVTALQLARKQDEAAITATLYKLHKEEDRLLVQQAGKRRALTEVLTAREMTEGVIREESAFIQNPPSVPAASRRVFLWLFLFVLGLWSRCINLHIFLTPNI